MAESALLTFRLQRTHQGNLTIQCGYWLTQDPQPNGASDDGGTPPDGVSHMSLSRPPHRQRNRLRRPWRPFAAPDPGGSPHRALRDRYSMFRHRDRCFSPTPRSHDVRTRARGVGSWNVEGMPEAAPGLVTPVDGRSGMFLDMRADGGLKDAAGLVRVHVTPSIAGTR
jgi:hypothetical protein